MPVLAYIVFQHPSVQTYFAKRFAHVISQNLGTEVNVGKAYFVFFDRLILRDVYILYNQSDTLISANKISATFALSDLLHSNLKFKSVKLDNGVFNLISETKKSTNLDRVFKTKEKSKKSGGKGGELNINSLSVTNFRFRLYNPYTGSIDYGPDYINFSNLNIKDINIEVRNIRNSKDTLFANLKMLSAKDVSGFRVDEMHGKISISKKEARISNLFINDGFTKLNAEHFSFYYETAKDFADFTNKIKMELNLNDTYFSFRTIGKITPSLKDNHLGVHLKGYAAGNLSSISTKDLIATSESGFSSLTLNSRISGLPKAKMTTAFVDIKNCQTTTYDLFDIISKINNQKQLSIAQKLSPGITYYFEGGLAGLLTDFVASGKITSSIGNMNVDLLLKSDRANNGFGIYGGLVADNFDAGKLLMIDKIGKVSLKTSVSAILRTKERGGNKITIDSLLVNRADINNYTYSNIYANGKFENSLFDGKVICHDPNLDFLFQGILGLSQKEENHYDFYANVIYADLAALKLDKRDSVSKISFRTISNYTRKPSGDIFGSIDISSVNYTNSKGNFDIGDIRFKSLSKTDEFWATLTSDFADAEYRGKEFFSHFLDVATEMIVQNHTPALLKSHKNTELSEQDRYQLSLKIKESNAISELLMPGLFISKNSTFNLSIINKKLSLSVKSPLAGYKKNIVYDLNSEASFSSESAKIELFSKRISTPFFIFENSSAQISAQNGVIKVEAGYRNPKEYKSSLKLLSEISFYRDNESNTLITTCNIVNSSLTTGDVPWIISNSSFALKSRDITINNFKISHNNQVLSASGHVSERNSDTLRVAASEIDLESLNLLISEKFDIKGVLSGDAAISGWYKDPAIELDVNGRDLFINKTPAGNLSLKSTWDPIFRGFNINIENVVLNKRVLVAEGRYIPDKSYLDISTHLNDFDISYFEPFISSVFSDIKGKASADIQLSGPFKKLNITCDNGKLKSASLKVLYTNVRYSLESDFASGANSFRLTNAIVKDRFGNRGKVSFILSHNNFKSFGLNANMDFSNIEGLNTSERDNPAFYGNLFATGNMRIGGNFGKVLMNIEASTNPNSVFHIPLSSSAEATETNLLTFVSNTPKKDTTLLFESPSKKSEKSTSMEIKIRAVATPDAALKIEINKAVGDVITGYGNGIIDLDVKTEEKTFNIYGDYIIDRGNYQFGYALKQFDINNGGRISFNGNIANTNLNLTTSYKTKASINTLIADTASVGNRRTVDCQISMSGPLMNPTLGFNIDIPDLDPATEARVSAALNSEDKVLRQFMSVLISGGFVPDMQSNIVNNSNIIYSNLSEIFSNQLNTILNQLQIPLDLNFNYQQGNSGQDIFDAAVSAQLMDNRIIVNGNIGNSPYASSSGSVTGDIEFEIKLDNKGKIRAKLFSRSADQYSNYLESNQRNGFGVVYQEEFDSFKELFQKIFGRNRKIKVEPSQSAR